MNRIRPITVASLVLLLAASALPAQDTGNANFSKYVALGDSLTAGFWSAGLASQQQVVSYPALIHLEAGGGGTFEQPSICDLGSNPADPCVGLPNQWQLTFSLTIENKPGKLDPPDCSSTPPNPGDFINYCLARPYDNLGTPGATLQEALTEVCAPGFQVPLRIGGQPQIGVFPSFVCTVLNRNTAECSDVMADPGAGACQTPGPMEQAGKSQVDWGLDQSPTFVSVWLGPADVLGPIADGTLDDLTDPADFATDYRVLMDKLIASGAGLAVANVPDVTKAPVPTLPWFVVNPATGEPVLDPGGNLIPLIGTTTTGARALTPADRVLLTALPELQMGIGVPPPIGAGTPLSDSSVLDMDEVAAVQQAVVAYNGTIAAEAQRAGAAFVDIFAFFNNAHQNGILIGGIQYTTEFLSGGLFSYDGVHPNSLGYALVANEFIQAINARFVGNIGLVDLFPFVFGLVGGAVQLPAGAEQAVQMTEEAWSQMRAVLGSPQEVAPQPRDWQRFRTRPNRSRGGRTR